ncbi:MAG: YjfB family protein [Lachnospiraceae bacterium]|nr:YjfB family protein [Lachnospiraceae bacterium]
MRIGGIESSIAAASVGYAQGTAMQSISTAVLSKALDNQETAGEGIVKMIDSAATAAMERSVNPHIGGNFDMSV